jgi:hypothetical protein
MPLRSFISYRRDSMSVGVQAFHLSRNLRPKPIALSMSYVILSEA